MATDRSRDIPWLSLGSGSSFGTICLKIFLQLEPTNSLELKLVFSIIIIDIGSELFNVLMM